jgi:hypothetical protein
MRAVRVLPLVVLLAVAGCSGGGGKSSTPPELSANYTTVDGEYQQAKSQLDLPAGAAFPDHLPNTAEHYLPGSGANQAQNFWLCAWLRDYLDAPPADAARTRKAVGQLPRYTAMSAYTAGLRPEGRALVDAAIQGTQRGDKQAATKFVESTCGGPFYSRASAAPTP